jgi:hypothetical protein
MNGQLKASEQSLDQITKERNALKNEVTVTKQLIEEFIKNWGRQKDKSKTMKNHINNGSKVGRQNSFGSVQEMVEEILINFHEYKTNEKEFDEHWGNEQLQPNEKALSDFLSAKKEGYFKAILTLMKQNTTKAEQLSETNQRWK